MLSKSKIKELSQLHLKKYRDEQKVFIAEGNKLVSDLLGAFYCNTIIATSDWIKQHSPKAEEIISVNEEELKKVSLLKTPQQVLAVFKQPTYTLYKNKIANSLSLALDDIQDPGNLGTILRIADWFGIETVLCSAHCADVYNPKTIQASMGAIARVQVLQVDLVSFIQEIKKDIPVYGTFLEGNNIYQEALSNTGIIVMGNEGNGISPALEKIIEKRLLIPNYPSGRTTSESLNVGAATAIICAEFRRRV
jgi:TrmH family RNA methyltransferase